MNSAVLLAVVGAAACAAAAPASRATKDVKTISYYNDNDGLNSYRFGYNLSDGTSRDEHGELKDVGTDHEALVVRGSYSFKGDDGITYTVNFVADENGYRPELFQTTAFDGQVVAQSPPAAVIASLLGG